MLDLPNSSAPLRRIELCMAESNKHRTIIGGQIAAHKMRRYVLCLGCVVAPRFVCSDLTT